MPDAQPCILVLDDAPEFLEFMTVLLTSDGYRALVADSLPTARTLLATTRPHLIICDVRLGGLAPFAALEQLQADPVTAAIPLLVCTAAVGDVQERAAALADAGVPVLLKPFDIDELLNRVRQRCGDAAPEPGA